MYQYKQSGLDNVWLADGYKIINTPYGEAVQFEDANSLDLAIANALIHQKEPLTGKEFRFLRQQIGMSQNDVATFMHVDAQSVARWEKGQTSLPFANEAIMRFIYSSYQEKDAKIYPILETMKVIDKARNSRLILSFDKDKTNWKVNKEQEHPIGSVI